jgi:hypothetical protein
MSVILIPTSRWISLTLTFPGIGSVTRDRSIYKPVTCSEEIAAKLLAKFYAKLPEGAEPLIPIPPEPTEDATEDSGEVPPAVTAETPAVPALTPTEHLLLAINASQTADELKSFGLNGAKANSVFDSLPLDESSLNELIPAKALAALIAKYD